MTRRVFLPTDWPGYPPRFRPAGKPSVKGGRWFVRKYSRWGKSKGPVWRAWTQGKNKSMSRSFKTHREAIEWAQFHAGRTTA